MSKVSLYYNTIKNMKPSQVINRLLIKTGKGCKLGKAPSPEITGIQKIESPIALDFDPVVLTRFSVDELMNDKITILHSSKDFDWKSKWNFDDKSALWNFNLHYFEFLFPLLKAWQDTGEIRFLYKTTSIIENWIDNNPIGAYPAWASYTTSLRIVVWISYYGYVEKVIDDKFRERLLQSLHDQYVFLSQHLEKDILGNHYFENLKSLVLASIFFKDELVFEKAISNFKKECEEEILSDGMHFELSPMYHKIVFEGILRIAVALRSIGLTDKNIEAYLKPMLDVAYSFENGLDRIPLFNDAGNNVAKSLNALLETSELFGLKPEYKKFLEKSGFYFFEKKIKGHKWRLIVDAGLPGPKYIPGHAHCDAMSYELFYDGKPVVVNCGTFAYQCNERDFFRSTAAHNTVMIAGTEQSQCWGAFRLAKRSKTKVLDTSNEMIKMEMTDQKGHRIQRTILLDVDGLTVTDEAPNLDILSYAHLSHNVALNTIEGTTECYTDPYAIDYGKKSKVMTYELSCKGCTKYKIILGDQCRIDVKSKMEKQYEGFKPLAFIDSKLIFYKNGSLWTVRNFAMKPVVKIYSCSWRDKTRALIRLFRREPKIAVPIDKHRLIISSQKKLILVDIDNKDIQVVFTARKAFSDPLNICRANSIWLIIWGDYGSNNNHESINIYGLKEDLSTEIIYSFNPGQVRHVHNIIPRIDGGYYIFTGDQENSAGIYMADSGFKEVIPVAVGKQQYRAVIGFDNPKGLIYATDAVNENNYVYLMKNNIMKQICKLNGSCIYGTKINEEYFFATTVEPDENKRGRLSWLSRKRGAGILSDEVTLVKVGANLESTVLAKYKKDNWPMKMMQYGSIQFPQGNSAKLWIYPVAVKGFDGKAVMINE